MERKVVVITGASSGLGSELAKLYLTKDCDLILSGRNESGLAAFRRENVDLVIGDLTDARTIDGIADAVARRGGRVDILINNAGMVHIQPFEANTAGQLDAIFEINVKAHMRLTQTLFPVMKQRRAGHVINIISTAGLEPKINHTMYCATKFALRGFTESLRLEAERSGIKVTGVYPGGMKTDIFDELPQTIDTSSFMDPAAVAKVIVGIADAEGVCPDSIVLRRMSASGDSLYDVAQ